LSDADGESIASNLRLVGQATWHDTRPNISLAPYDTLLKS
jgi:hypothetical protein